MKKILNGAAHATAIVNAAVVATAVLSLAACKPKLPEIAFAPYGPDYQSKTDFAQVEHKFPLTTAQLKSLTRENLAQMDQEQLDQIYARLTAGPIPNGPFEGDLFFPKGLSGKTRLSEIAGGGLKSLLTQAKLSKLDGLGEVLWKGKVFYRDQRVLRNRIEDLALLKPLISGELKDLRKETFNGKDQWLLFPAKLYCGQSLLDGRRESIIIDYAFTDEIEGFNEWPDFLAGRRGFKVRDEIRMIRPGLYLGRAYLDKVFALNFVLENKTIGDAEAEAFYKTGESKEDCWSGTQQRGSKGAGG